ncbi:SDR family oxidoreductase [Paracoccus onubensis]|uniref:SDR family oxidoreductase n=1 Tax=Paracoccus onubensis TaxID=1675788 RepID=A0A418SY84_9RHOB|nr:SDR family oxidoreductase [Paracoccus onubensis]RJE85890.1 SDR family oxidoreductase [Paracoccus onubensis]
MSMRVAIVIGAGTGIGKAIATALHGDGFHVALFGRRKEVLDEAASGIDPSGDRLQAVPVDIGQRDAVGAAFAAVIERWGRLDLLVNNAGMNPSAVPLEDITAEEWGQVVGVNLTGAFFCTQFAFRQFKAQQPQGGRIINNGSVSATMPRPLASPYAATKAGVSGLTRASALDGRPFNIAVGQIDIGNASTEMTRRMATGVMQPDGSLAVEPTIDIAHIADAVRYMAGLPLDANALTLTVMATQMPFVGRG